MSRIPYQYCIDSTERLANQSLTNCKPPQEDLTVDGLSLLKIIEQSVKLSKMAVY
jgi:hypothetical protein